MLFRAAKHCVEGDLVDDLFATGDCLSHKAGLAGTLARRMRPYLGSHAARLAVDGLDSRRHRWVLAGAIAIAVGVLLAAAKWAGEGAAAGRLVTVATVMISFEAMGMLTGYALLGRFLGLYR